MFWLKTADASKQNPKLRLAEVVKKCLKHSVNNLSHTANLFYKCVSIVLCDVSLLVLFNLFFSLFEAGLISCITVLSNTWNSPKSGAWLWAKSPTVSMRLKQWTLIWHTLPAPPISHALNCWRLCRCFVDASRVKHYIRASSQIQTGPLLSCLDTPVAVFYSATCVYVNDSWECKDRGNGDDKESTNQNFE